ncbi:MAG TPA: tetratricopeptide repeat protein [Vicinamibacteria bacterium]|nr:tetratricopeptide repeat protein [Vicinamibacteria bacterium]
MKRVRILFPSPGLTLAVIALGALLAGAADARVPRAEPSPGPPGMRVADLRSHDGTLLKASYFAAPGPGPGVLLFHQSNRARGSWDGLAAHLAAAGLNTLTIDSRRHGESGRTAPATDPNREHDNWAHDADTALQYLLSQPGVTKGTIGVGGAGALGVDASVETARRHPAEVRSLVLISGETLPAGLRFLREASQLPGLFVVSDDDEYPPIPEGMERLYISSSNPGKKFVHYVAAKAPWLWYETSDAARVPPTGHHGTDLFPLHPELPGTIVDWFVTTLIKTPGHAPANALASAPILNQIELPGGVAQVTRQLMEARRKDPQAQLFPEVNVDMIGADHTRLGETKAAIEIFKLNLLAYPDSADAHNNLADAYLKDGQRELARQYAKKALALLDSHRAPASSWSDTDERRGEIRKDVERILKALSEGLP